MKEKVKKLVLKSLRCSVLMASVLVPLSQAAAQNKVPFSITSGLFDLTNQKIVGLSQPEGLMNMDVFVPSENTHHYSNQAMMAAFKGVIHMMWQNSPTDEDTDDTVVTWIYSTDNGDTWSVPVTLAKGDDKTYCTSGGWLVTDDKLVAYINVWNYGKKPLRVDYMTTTDGINWTDRKHVKMADGSDLGCEFGQDPHIFKNGRIVCSGHFPTTAHPEGKHLWPLYTDDPMGVTGWKKGKFTNTAKSTDVQTRELEPSFYQKGQDSIIMTMRDQKSSYYILASVSTDNGETWSNAVQTDMPDSRSKQCAGNLPDGTAYIVNNPYRINKPRCPLAITLSKDGSTFTHSYLLRGLDELPEQTYSGWAKTLGYSYPKAMVYNGYLWVSYSIQKERVGFSRIPLASISLNSSSAQEDDNSKPFSIIDGLFDSAFKETMGLDKAPGAETHTVFAASDGSPHYANGVVMTAFKGDLYCMWQTSAKDEDAEDTYVAYARSTDGGTTWSSPMVLCPTISNGYCASGGWLSTDDRLIGYINVRTKEIANSGGFTQYVESTDGMNWTQPQNVKMADGSQLNGIFEQDPHVLSDGRIICAAHFQPGLKLCPIYTDDPTGRTGWTKGNFQYTDNGAQSAELEPSFYRKPNGTLVMVMRDQKGSYKVLASMSRDRGETWSKAVQTNMPDSRAKQCAGNLPDGTAFLVNNPGRVTNSSNTTWRVPLALTLSNDGNTFDRSYLLRSGEAGDYTARRYEGKSKTLGYSYPKALVYDGYLYVSYSTNKDDAQYTRVPIKNITSGIDTEQLAVSGSVILRGHTLFIMSPNPGIAVDVYDLTGSLIYHERSDADEAEFLLNNCPPGVYLVRVRLANGTINKKIVIRR